MILDKTLINNFDRILFRCKSLDIFTGHEGKEVLLSSANMKTSLQVRANEEPSTQSSLLTTLSNFYPLQREDLWRLQCELYYENNLLVE